MIHDMDRGYQEENVAEKLQELESGMRWIHEMKDSGIISGFGAGIKDAEMMSLFLEHFDLDFFLVSMPYTLLD